MKFLLTIVVLLLITDLLAQPDTSMTFWENGNRKTITWYKSKRYHDREQDTTIVLKQVKRKEYFDLNGKTVSASRFNEIEFDHEWEKMKMEQAIWEDNQQLKQAAYGHHTDPSKVSITLRDSLIGGPINLQVYFGDSTDRYSYAKKDTSINGQWYTILIYDSSRFCGAMRNTNEKIYLLDKDHTKEELLLDIHSITDLAREAGQSLVVTEEKLLEWAAKGLYQVSELGGQIRNHLLAGLLTILASGYRR